MLDFEKVDVYVAGSAYLGSWTYMFYNNTAYFKHGLNESESVERQMTVDEWNHLVKAVKLTNKALCGSEEGF